MAVLPIRTFPSPFLKKSTRPIGRITPSVHQLVDDLIETMRHHPRCVGLAAPQVGCDVRIAVIDVAHHPKATGSCGLLVCINPQLLVREGGSVQREGCLSVPDLTANVPRATRVQLKALDATGEPWARWLDGFEAIVAQHEVDHLDGTLFLDRVGNVKSDVFRRKTYLFPPEQSAKSPSTKSQ